jgi:hypothetical protein
MENLKTGIIDIGTFHKMYAKGEIIPYKNNRGGNVYDKRRAKKYAASWDTASSGCAVVEKTKDGYMLRDFHNRAEAIRLGVESGTISPKEPLLIRVLPPGDGLTAYNRINSAQKHSSIEKFKNQDLAMGFEIAKVILNTKLSNETISSRFYQHLSYAIIDLKVKKRSEFSLLSGSYGAIQQYIDLRHEDADEIKLSPTQVKQIAAGVNFWATIRDEVSEDTNAIEKIFKSGTFFGFVIFDYMFKRKLGDPSQVAKAIVRRQRKIAEITPKLTVGPASDRLERERMLLTELNAT